jgi:hypothetical protein
VSPPSNFLEIEMTTEIETGGPAYPIHGYSNGLMIRDYFAGLAMQAYLGKSIDRMHDENQDVLWVDSDIAEMAYELADAMLKARK